MHLPAEFTDIFPVSSKNKLFKDIINANSQLLFAGDVIDVGEPITSTRVNGHKIVLTGPSFAGQMTKYTRTCGWKDLCETKSKAGCQNIKLSIVYMGSNLLSQGFVRPSHLQVHLFIICTRMSILQFSICNVLVISLAQLSPSNPIRGLSLPLDALIESRLTPFKDLWQDHKTVIFGNHKVWVLYFFKSNNFI